MSPRYLFLVPCLFTLYIYTYLSTVAFDVSFGVQSEDAGTWCTIFSPMKDNLPLCI